MTALPTEPQPLPIHVTLLQEGGSQGQGPVDLASVSGQQSRGQVHLRDLDLHRELGLSILRLKGTN